MQEIFDIFLNRPHLTSSRETMMRRTLDCHVVPTAVGIANAVSRGLLTPHWIATLLPLKIPPSSLCPTSRDQAKRGQRDAHNDELSALFFRLFPQFCGTTHVLRGSFYPVTLVPGEQTKYTSPEIGTLLEVSTKAARVPPLVGLHFTSFLRLLQFSEFPVRYTTCACKLVSNCTPSLVLHLGVSPHLFLISSPGKSSLSVCRTSPSQK